MSPEAKAALITSLIAAFVIFIFGSIIFEATYIYALATAFYYFSILLAVVVIIRFPYLILRDYFKNKG